MNLKDWPSGMGGPCRDLRPAGGCRGRGKQFRFVNIVPDALLVLPPGKVLEMATIEAVRALGLEQELGSLEVGKRAAEVPALRQAVKKAQMRGGATHPLDGYPARGTHR